MTIDKAINKTRTEIMKIEKEEEEKRERKENFKSPRMNYISKIVRNFF